MFLKERQRVPGVLVGDLLALSRGETITKRRRLDAAPHHVTCPTCGFDRWDNRSPHPKGGKRFASKCLGPTLEQRQAAAGDATVSAGALVEELLTLASAVPTDAAPEPPLPEPVKARTVDLHHFRSVG